MKANRDNGRKLLKEGLSKINLEISDKQIDQFMRYYELLLEWNSVMNLTAITEFEDVISKHFIDSISITNILNISNQKIIDIGTGAGFPGIPLKIMFPEIEITLLDSLNKRVNFLNHIIDELSLDKIEAIHGRAEDIAHNEDYRENYDIALSRAVARLPILLEYCIPFVKENGYFISYKSENVDEEIELSKKALETLASEFIDSKKYKLKDSENERYLVMIRKNDKISKKYPRKAGLPAKRPL